MDGASYTISQIVLESASFSHRDDFLAIPPVQSIAEGGMQLELSAEIDEEHSSAVVILRARSEDDVDPKPLYSFNVRLVALLELAGKLPDTVELRRGLIVSGAHTLVPFLRETVANLTSRGRFGTLWIQPINVLQLLDQPSAPEVEAPGADQAPTRRPPRKKSPAKAR